MSINQSNPNVKCQTYFSTENEESAKLEIDLVTYREKGIEDRGLVFSFSVLNSEVNPPARQDGKLIISTKEEFDALKAFFSQLNWED